MSDQLNISTIKFSPHPLFLYLSIPTSSYKMYLSSVIMLLCSANVLTLLRLFHNHGNENGSQHQHSKSMTWHDSCITIPSHLYNLTTTLFVLCGIRKSVLQNRCLNANVPSVPVNINNFLSAYILLLSTVIISCLTRPSRESY